MSRCSIIGLFLFTCCASCSSEEVVGCSAFEEMCIQYAAEDAAALEAPRQACVDSMAAVVDECDSENLAGCCRIERDGYVETQCFYSPFSATQEWCDEQGGTLVDEF